MYLYLYYVYTIPTSHFVIPTPYPIFLRKRISDFRALRKKQVGKQLLVAVGMDSSELDDVLDVALNLTEQCMSLKVACGLGWVGGDDGYLLCCWLDIGWWWLNVVDVGKNIPPKVGLVVFFQVLGDWILIQVNGKFLVFCKKIRCSGFQFCWNPSVNMIIQHPGRCFPSAPLNLWFPSVQLLLKDTVCVYRSCDQIGRAHV